ncbi:hypothetical protein BDF21DRAFT_421953 [Thamnidium elegans]|nr:hypothetical protein BDF21DRAFT_421953 [Thamnidium elegans]
MESGDIFFLFFIVGILRLSRFKAIDSILTTLPSLKVVNRTIYIIIFVCFLHYKLLVIIHCRFEDKTCVFYHLMFSLSTDYSFTEIII